MAEPSWYSNLDPQEDADIIAGVDLLKEGLDYIAGWCPDPLGAHAEEVLEEGGWLENSGPG